MKFLATALLFLTSLFWQAGGQFSGGGVNSTLNGGPAIVTVAKYDATAQQANIGTTTVYTVPANGGGLYCANAFLVETQAATTSSTEPSTLIAWTDNDTSVLETVAATGGNSGANSIGTTGLSVTNPGLLTFEAKPGTTISVSTTGYVSSGATPMQYAIHVKLEYLGQ